MIRVATLLAVLLSPALASAADVAVRFHVGAIGGTGMRYRVPGGSWQTGTAVSGGIVAVPADDGVPDSIEVEVLGVPFGKTTVSLTGWQDLGDVDVSFGGLSFSNGSASRAVTTANGSGSSTSVSVFDHVLNGAGGVFGVEDFAAMMYEASDRMGGIVGMCVGVTFVWILLAEGLRWARSAFGGAEAGPDEWKEHRREADKLLEKNRRSRDAEEIYESEIAANDDWLEKLGEEGRGHSL